ncbi:hypothetical protein L842_0236 [Mycobacterium intracellulare MIN_052511_1280]|nr:hypothetical protein L842_0236 [Mycobacterium intracellulare MIN_052511_1280]
MDRVSYWPMLAPRRISSRSHPHSKPDPSCLCPYASRAQGYTEDPDHVYIGERSIVRLSAPIL